METLHLAKVPLQNCFSFFFCSLPHYSFSELYFFFVSFSLEASLPYSRVSSKVFRPLKGIRCSRIGGIGRDWWVIGEPYTRLRSVRAFFTSLGFFKSLNVHKSRYTLTTFPKLPRFLRLFIILFFSFLLPISRS